MKRLVIIGNGFDLHHGMQTSYLNYREYLLRNGGKDIVECFEEQEELNEIYLWNNLEHVLGLLNYEKAYCYLLPYNDENWRDSAHHDFQYEIEKMTQYWPGIKDNLANWIRQIDYTKADKNLFFIINNDSSFLSFNYTNTLEVLYGINKESILYIHGDVSGTEELVLGHRNESYYPEWDINNEDCDVRLLEADQIMESHRLNTQKDIESIINQNSQFFEGVDIYDEVYVLGLSYNDIDAEYLKKIAENGKRLKWYFNWYSREDYAEIDEYAKKIGIHNYKKINIDMW